MTSSQTSLPGFSAEQTNSLTIFIQNMVNTTLHKHFGLPPPQPIQQQPPKQVQPPKQEQEPPLQQVNTEKATEKVISSSNVTTATTSLRPIILHQSATQYGRDAHPIGSSNAPFLATLPTSLLASFFVSLLALPLGYIEYAKDMEATGQG